MNFPLALVLLSFALPSLAGRGDFSSRLGPRLLIAGEKCQGGEASGVSRRRCTSLEWLITLDDANICAPDGGCTEIGVPPFIGHLRRAPVVTPTTIAFYEIVPNDLVSLPRRKLLRNYWVRSYLNAAMEFVPRPVTADASE
jgi:hypothetical protein